MLVRLFQSKWFFSSITLLQCFLCFAQDEEEEGPDAPPAAPPAAPIDSHIWVLGVVAILLAIYFFYKINKQNVEEC